MKTMKTIVYGTLLISAALGLSGCSSQWNAVETAFIGPSNEQVVEQQQATIRHQCDEAPILYANLTTSYADRMYTLPDPNQTLCI